MSISIRSIARQSAKFNVVNIISFLILIPTQLIIGRHLLPQEYGIISFVTLWALYGGLTNPGMASAASREVPYLLGKKEEVKAKLIQDVSISSDIIWSGLPFLVILIASFYYPDRIIRIALLITGINFVIERLASYWSRFNFAKQKFTLVAIGRLIGAIARPVFIIITIYWLKIYAVLLAPLFSGVLMLLYYLKKGPIDYRFKLDWGIIKKLIKIGIAFSLNGLIFYGYRMADRTVIASYLPLYELGLFTFAMGFILFATNFLADFGRVLEPILWKNSGENEGAVDFFSILKRISVYFALLIAIGIPLLQIGYGYIIPLITPNYMNSVIVFNVLSLYIFLVALATFPSVCLNSSAVNKQNQLTFLYGIGLGFAVLFDIVLVRLGFGIVPIAMATIISHGVITFSAYFLARPYISEKWKDFVALMSKILFPFIIAVLFTIFNSFDFFKTGIVPRPIVSLFLQILVWTVVLGLFYRGYFTKRQIIEIYSEIKNKFKSYFPKKNLNSL